LATKLFLWPLAIWLAGTRRYAAAVWSIVGAVALIALSWAVIGFDGLREYPDLLQRLQELLAPESFTIYALALDFGVSEAVARALWIALGVALVAGVVLLARRGDDKRAFVIALAASLACTPLVWLHYFALLLVGVAIMQPRLALVWFIPLAMYLSTATHNGSTFQNALTVFAGSATVAVALLPARAAKRPAFAPRSSPAPGPP
jgi:hypothetical protein